LRDGHDGAPGCHAGLRVTRVSIISLPQLILQCNNYLDADLGA
jgi:hypothetical protein